MLNVYVHGSRVIGRKLESARREVFYFAYGPSHRHVCVHVVHRHRGAMVIERHARNPAKKRLMTTPKIVLYDQTGPAAGTRAATSSRITATTRKIAAINFQTQPKSLTVFDPHFGHVTSAFMDLVRVAMEQETGISQWTGALLDSV
jgi:hypothetical protein